MFSRVSIMKIIQFFSWRFFDRCKKPWRSHWRCLATCCLWTKTIIILGRWNCPNMGHESSESVAINYSKLVENNYSLKSNWALPWKLCFFVIAMHFFFSRRQMFVQHIACWKWRPPNQIKFALINFRFVS